MQVKTRYFGLLRLATGVISEVHELREGSTVQQLMDLLAEKYGETVGRELQGSYGIMLQRGSSAGEHVPRHLLASTTLEDADVVSLVYQFTGG